MLTVWHHHIIEPYLLVRIWSLEQIVAMDKTFATVDLVLWDRFS